jgi:hypothetical protein
MSVKKKILQIVKIVLGVLLLGSVVYIMVNGLGLIDSLDFGAGAYYYADIPGFASLVDGSHYENHVPMGVLILLFLIWGFAMYKLWEFLEKKLK